MLGQGARTRLPSERVDPYLADSGGGIRRPIRACPSREVPSGIGIGGHRQSFLNLLLMRVVSRPFGFCRGVPGMAGLLRPGHSWPSFS